MAERSSDKTASVGLKAKPPTEVRERRDAHSSSVHDPGRALRDCLVQPRTGLNQPVLEQQLLGNRAVLRRPAAGWNSAGLNHLFSARPIIGNQGLTRRLQTKLKVNTPGDQYEREADHVADQVMSVPATGAAAPAVSPVVSGVQRKCSCDGSTTQCDKCEDEEKKLQRSASVPAPSAYAPPIVHDVLRSPGRPLDSATRSFMESRFGHDFSAVRLHTDAGAQESARALRARAYTVGSDIAFGPGRYEPESVEGRHLLAHELAHVVQQNGDATPVLRRAPEEPLSWWHMRNPEVPEAKRLLNRYHEEERAAGREGLGKGWRPLADNDYVEDRMPPALGAFQRQKKLRHQDSRLWQETLDALRAATAPPPKREESRPAPPPASPAPAPPAASASTPPEKEGAAGPPKPVTNDRGIDWTRVGQVRCMDSFIEFLYQGVPPRYVHCAFEVCVPLETGYGKIDESTATAIVRSDIVQVGKTVQEELQVGIFISNICEHYKNLLRAELNLPGELPGSTVSSLGTTMK